jgi:hypothetical protein
MIQGVIHILKGSDAVTADVGVNTKGNKPKIYPVVCPQDEDGTYLICLRVSQAPTQSRCVSELDFATIQLKACASDYETADRITNNARLAIEGFEGISNGVDIASVAFLDISDGYDGPADKIVLVSSYKIGVRRKIKTIE